MFLHYTRTISLTAGQFKINSEVFGNFGNCTAPALFANIFSPLFKITWVNKDNMTAPEDVCGSMARGYADKPLVFLLCSYVNCFRSTTSVLSHCIWVMTFLDSEIGLSCSSFSFCTTTLLSLRLSLRSAFTLHPYYFIAFDLLNSSCTPSADGSAITRGAAVTFPHFYFSRSARLTADSGFTLHQYYFIEVDLVNCFCTTSVLFH